MFSECSIKIQRHKRSWTIFFRRDAELDIPGEPINNKVGMWDIDLPDGTVEFMVHRGPPCAGGSMSIPGWNIPEGTVTGLSFYPAFKKPITVDQLPFSLGLFKKRNDESTTYYSNRTEGIEVRTNGNKVAEVSFFPRADMWFMRCHRDDEAEVIIGPSFVGILQDHIKDESVDLIRFRFRDFLSSRSVRPE